MIKVLLCFILSLALFFLSPNNAFAEECPGFWGEEQKLPNDLKEILINEVAIPVISPDISGADKLSENAKFKNLIVSYTLKQGSKVETGSKLDLLTLKDANGYASVEFKINYLEDVSKISEYLKKIHSYYIDSIYNVQAKLQFKDKDGREISSKPFKLRTGNNKVIICNDTKTKGVSTIEIEVLSFEGKYHISHEFSES